MKISKRQLRRIIKEAMPAGRIPDTVGAITGVPGGNIQNLVDEYKEWAIDYMGTPSGANSSSVLATFIVDRELDQGPMADNIMKDMAREMKFDIADVRKAVNTTRDQHTSNYKGHKRMNEKVEEVSIKITKNYLDQIIRETLELDLDVGDVILTGKFKNKRKIVKDFGTDDLGQPTVNGTKALNFRIEKHMPKEKWSKESKEALEFAENVEESKVRITKSRLRNIIREEVSLSKGRNLDYGKGEGRMTRSQLHHIAEYAAILHDMIQDEDDLPEWVQSKVSVMASDIGKVKHYLEYKILRIQAKEGR